MTRKLTRRALLGTVGLAATAGCLGLGPDGGSSSRGGETEGDGFSSGEFGGHPDARMVRYDAANSGAIPDAAGPTAEPTETWRTDRTLGSPARPTTLRDILFTNATNGVAGFTTDGERRWAYRTNQSDLNPAPPAVVDDRVFATRTTALFALDAKVGTEWWVFTPSQPTNRLTAPAVAGDTVYVVGQHPEQPPTLWAVARLDGAVRWEVELAGESAAPPVVAGGTVYCLTTDGGLYAVDIDSERTVWTRSLSPVIGPPAVDASRVYVPVDDAVVAYGTDGSSRWRTPGVTGPRGAHDGLVVGDGLVYGTRADGQALVALSTETGDEQWAVELSGDAESPIVVDGTVYVQDAADIVRAISAGDRTEEWSMQGTLREATGITVTGGGFVVGGDSRLARYD